MRKSLFNPNLIKDKDISQYLKHSILELNTIIDNLELLYQQHTEKEHVIDILKECLFIEDDLSILLLSYQNVEDDTVFQKIENHFRNISSIQEELITDYPDIFQNQNKQWWKFTPSSSPTEPYESLYLAQTKHTNFIFKRWIFGFFFLLPFFIFIFFYFIVNNKIQHLEENRKKQSIYEYDRPYKNIFYIYSTVLKNKGNDNNFYSLLGKTSFQLPEGFVIVDKNLIVDYYLKEYYGLYDLKNENTTLISVTNLNFLQCKYILTKFSFIPINKIMINEQLVDMDHNDVNQKKYCDEEHKSNILSIYLNAPRPEVREFLLP